jgi:hypothetical protein
MNRKYKPSVLTILVSDFVSVLEELVYEIYTRLYISPQEGKEVGIGRRMKPININYCDISTKDTEHNMDAVFDFIFEQTLEYRKKHGLHSTIDDYGQLGI